MAQEHSLFALQRKEDKTFLEAREMKVPCLFSSEEEANKWVNNFEGDKIKKYIAETFTIVEVMLVQRFP